MKYIALNNTLLNWYASHKRDLPWRSNTAPYQIWISEIILQQTRVYQGIEYYKRFIKLFPSISDLAVSDEESVLKIWQGLGYYSRARNLHKTSKIIVKQLNNTFPSNSSELKKLPGIGDYTAAAIASICFNEPVAAVDGNVYRILSRVFDINSPFDTSNGKKTFNMIANEWIDTKNPGDFNQAMMDLGALVCTPQNPNCTNCPFSENCLAKQNNTIELRPLRSKKTSQKNRYLYYIYMEDEKHIVFSKRTGKDIWKNLYQFPLIEMPSEIPIEKLFENKQWKTLWGDEPVTIMSVMKAKPHMLTHQKLFITFVKVFLPVEKILPENFILTSKNNIFDFPVPKPIEQYLENELT